MARCLARRGYALRLYDLRHEVLAGLAKEGDAFQAARDPSDLARDLAVVITMLPDALAVRDAALGNEDRAGFAGTLGNGGVVIDMSSSAPLATQDLGRELAVREIGLVDAPVSGGVPRAREGTLTIMAGGDAALIDEVEPILGAMGRVFRTGPLGSGHAMKALNNYSSAAGLIAVCESLVIAERFGLDPRVMNEVLKASTGRNNTTDKKVEQFMLNRAFDSGFALALLKKDVGMAEGLAMELGLDAPGLRACCALLEQAARALGTGADHTEVFTYLQRRLAGEGDEG
jgi:3-hydroxyisobutyrate dehydrogenase